MSAVYEKAEQLPSPSCCESKVLAFELPANGRLKNGHAHRNWEAGLNVALRNTIPVSFLVDLIYMLFATEVELRRLIGISKTYTISTKLLN